MLWNNQGRNILDGDVLGALVHQCLDVVCKSFFSFGTQKALCVPIAPPRDQNAHLTIRCGISDPDPDLRIQNRQDDRAPRSEASQLPDLLDAGIANNTALRKRVRDLLASRDG